VMLLAGRINNGWKLQRWSLDARASSAGQERDCHKQALDLRHWLTFAL
jgi:hypothetical protein